MLLVVVCLLLCGRRVFLVVVWLLRAFVVVWLLGAVDDAMQVTNLNTKERLRGHTKVCIKQAINQPIKYSGSTRPAIDLVILSSCHRVWCQVPRALLVLTH